MADCLRSLLREIEVGIADLPDVLFVSMRRTIYAVLRRRNNKLLKLYTFLIRRLTAYDIMRAEVSYGKEKQRPQQ
jgi:hypothetical protein